MIHEKKIEGNLEMSGDRHTGPPAINLQVQVRSTKKIEGNLEMSGDRHTGPPAINLQVQVRVVL